MNPYRESAGAVGIFLVAFLGAVGLSLLLTRCSAAQPVTKDATCSPRAQSWWAREMAEQCGLKKAEDCHASKAIDAEFLERECIECAQNAGEAEECTKP